MGVHENLVVLQAVLRDAKTACRSVHLASLDVSKAFDSVSRFAIVDSLRGVGAPDRLVGYVRHLYEESRTYLEAGGRRSASISVRQGVRQGDPLSPLLFNLVVDIALRALPEEVGYRLGDGSVRALAFADDVLLVASTAAGLQRSLDAFSQALLPCGLSLNPGKCVAVSAVASGREKKVKVVDEVFRVGDSHLPTLPYGSTFRYLGFDFKDLSGVQPTNDADFRRCLEKISKAPLKPQQRLRVLVSHLIPAHSFGLGFGRMTLGRLRRLDKDVRGAVRRWLRLPNDVPTGFFHAPVKEGGLGIPAFVMSVPVQRSSVYALLGSSSWGPVRDSLNTTFHRERMEWCRRTAGYCNSPARSRRHFSRILHDSVDGKELRQVNCSRFSSDWVLSTSRFVRPRDYISYVHIRSNCLPSRSRLARGRPALDTKCRAGCQATETLAHIVQGCTRTHGGRVLRHDAICAIVVNGLQDAGWTCEREVLFKFPSGNLKPDIVASRLGVAVIIDTQVVSGAKDLEVSHGNKVRKYSGQDLLDAVASKLGVDSSAVRVSSCTLSWKGVWSATSVAELADCGLTKGNFREITRRALYGSLLNFRRFSHTTLRQA